MNILSIYKDFLEPNTVSVHKDFFRTEYSGYDKEKQKYSIDKQ